MADNSAALVVEDMHKRFGDLEVLKGISLSFYPGAKIGVSKHSIEEIRAATREGADYFHLAPVFAPLSKPATLPGAASPPSGITGGGAAVFLRL